GDDYDRVNVAAQQVDQTSLLNWFKHTLRVRKQHPAFGRGDLRLLPADNVALLAYWRTHRTDRVLVINNLSDQTHTLGLSDDLTYIDLLSGSLVTRHSSLSPYQFLWLQPTEA
ncbi:MAG: alpha-glucosidase C-terminal domain-containing protein, partial [Chloroflexi bacterium]|nr:alpha-glucosidase C-terminal domain-containing protein [Chloroflexota bacterium]